MAEHVIWIVIVVILAIGVLAFGSGLLSKANIIGDETETILDFGMNDLSGKNLYVACRDWLNSPNRYDAKAILDYYKIPEQAKPFGTYAQLQYCNGDTNSLRVEALTVVNSGGTNVDHTNGNVRNCITVCTNIVNCHDTIMNKHPSFSETQSISCMNKRIYRTSTNALVAKNCGDSDPTPKFSCP